MGSFLSSSKRKPRRGRRFPYHDLETSIQVIEKIKEGGVDKLESSTLAKAMKHQSDTSSTFKSKVNAAKHFGLITESKEREGERELRYYCISELGKKIVSPIGTTEKEKAIREAFFNFNLWKEIYNKYEKNGKLPERSTLENLLEREYGISPVSTSRAYDVFVNSGIFAGFFKETEEGIIYADVEEIAEEKEEEEEEGKEEIEKKFKLPQVTTSINVTITVDAKDETSVKNFITILDALSKLGLRKKE